MVEMPTPQEPIRPEPTEGLGPHADAAANLLKLTRVQADFKDMGIEHPDSHWNKGLAHIEHALENGWREDEHGNLLRAHAQQTATKPERLAGTVARTAETARYNIVGSGAKVSPGVEVTGAILGDDHASYGLTDGTELHAGKIEPGAIISGQSRIWGADIGRGVKIRDSAVSNATIGAGAEVTHSSIGDSRVGKGAKLHKVQASSTRIGEGAVIRYVDARRVKVGEGAQVELANLTDATVGKRAIVEGVTIEGSKDRRTRIGTGAKVRRPAGDSIPLKQHRIGSPKTKENIVTAASIGRGADVRVPKGTLKHRVLPYVKRGQAKK